MEIKQLLYFVTVVNEGNITAASKKLHIAQPALSKQIKDLEEELETKLFHRGPRKIILTDTGTIFYEKAIRMLELKHTIFSELQATKSGFKGTLRIGLISAIDADFLENTFYKFHTKFNKIKYEIYEGITPEIIEMLFSGVIEIGIVRTPFDTTGLKTIYLRGEPMIAAYSADIELDQFEDAISIKELRNKSVIIYRRFKDVVISAFQKEKIDPNILCINDDSRTSLLWANAGLGIAIVPKSSIGLVLANNLKYKIIDNQSLYTQNAIITLESAKLSNVSRNFINGFSIENTGD